MERKRSNLNGVGALQVLQEQRGYFSKNLSRLWRLNPGVSNRLRIGWLAGLAIIIGVAVLNFSGARKDLPVEKVAQSATQLMYKITEDEFSEGRPRRVKVLLNQRFTAEELLEVSNIIQANSKSNAQQTVIGFRIEGQSDAANWAQVRFTPDYAGTIYGLSVQEYQQLKTLDLKGYPDRIGSWLRDDALGHLMVLYHRDGQYFIDSIFPAGEKNTVTYLGQRLLDGGLRLQTPDNALGRYYVIDANGTFREWRENRVYLTLPPNLPAS